MKHEPSWVVELLDAAVRTALSRSAAASAGVAAAARAGAPDPAAEQTARQQLHGALDQTIDLAVTILELTQPARRSARAMVAAAAEGARTGGGAAGPRLGTGPLVLGPVTPGQSVTGRLLVRNDGAEPLQGIQLVCGGLLDSSGLRIAGHQVAVVPAAVDIAPGAEAVVEVKVDVPQGSRPTTYAGVLSAAGRPSVRTLVTVEVH